MFSKSFSTNQETIHPNNIYRQIERDYKFQGALTRHSYYPLDVGNILYSHCTRNNILSSLTKDEVAIVKNPIATKTNAAQRKNMVMNWFDIFDKMFFFGNLRKEINGIDFEDDELVEELNVVGAYDPTENHIFINIHEEKTLELKKYLTLVHQSYEEYFICVLFHEMTHAFISTYCCVCRPCRKIRQSITLGGDGRQGHGPLWADAMARMQVILQNLVKWNVNSCIDDSVREEMEFNKWEPSPSQLSRWGITRPRIPGKLTAADLPSRVTVHRTPRRCTPRRRMR